ncbi:MAG: ATPase, partial [Ruminococcus sp.]|nr:ATPase [Ruminococcus sp.]
MLEILQHSPAKAQQEDKREEYGLSSQQAQGILEKVGENVIAEKKKSSGMKIFLGQFHDVMVMILLIATVISVILGQYSDAVPMLAVVVINAFLGVIQDYRCEQTLVKL